MIHHLLELTRIIDIATINDKQALRYFLPGQAAKQAKHVARCPNLKDAPDDGVADKRDENS